MPSIKSLALAGLEDHRCTSQMTMQCAAEGIHPPSNGVTGTSMQACLARSAHCAGVLHTFMSPQTSHVLDHADEAPTGGAMPDTVRCQNKTEEEHQQEVGYTMRQTRPHVWVMLLMPSHACWHGCTECVHLL